MEKTAVIELLRNLREKFSLIPEATTDPFACDIAREGADMASGGIRNLTKSENDGLPELQK